MPYLLRAVRKEGPIEGYNIAIAKHLGYMRMQSAAVNVLPPMHANGATGSDIHFLTGSAHIFQTIFCAYSLQMHAGTALNPVLHDDGTLQEGTLEQMRKTLPRTVRMSEPEAVAHMAEYLPPAKFPVLWATRARFILMRKLMDVHASASGWKLFLDSDMLFFARPATLLGWLSAPDLPCCMVDAMNSYGYEERILASILRSPLPDFVNTGICGLNREDMDWELLEHRCRTLTEAHGINHFLEQALTAMWFSETPFRTMPRKDYITAPLREQILPAATGVMHHYVADSRTFLYRFGWRQVLDAALGQRSAEPVSALRG